MLGLPREEGALMPVLGDVVATHVTLESGDVARSLRFYTQVMGLPTLRRLKMAGLFKDTTGLICAAVQVPRLTPQPLLNFYARPVPDAAPVDRAYQGILGVQDAFGIQHVTPPAREDRARFGVGTYGFYVQDADGNWWRVEENDGPFGPAEIPPNAEPRDSIVPAGPVSYVTLECRDLARTMRFFRDFLGVDAEQAGPTWFHSRGNGGVKVLGVQVGDRLMEQSLMNHHGITLQTKPEQIDALNARAKETAPEFGIRKVMGATSQHGSYSFYLQDEDTNWWEIEILEGGLNPWQQTLRDGEWTEDNAAQMGARFARAGR
jgi:catechol 2,3-dioxygenase-like lactoylglutathione lyase family enzyme